ncbi:hypothetical protein CBR_g23784 [Chara braunii]|uniref:RING-type domain-containing protein n=1 Tax=Chara braunii TaxID=69332 RepID=A0A388JVM2_CHABU|nr:hypothetical protein CBR_g23784 [Chara braunii]|eukprot:GBG61828.1 hypothetical protein CBR_g23784 [Chara braunii]
MGSSEAGGGGGSSLSPHSSSVKILPRQLFPLGRRRRGRVQQSGSPSSFVLSSSMTTNCSDGSLLAPTQTPTQVPSLSCVKTELMTTECYGEESERNRRGGGGTGISPTRMLMTGAWAGGTPVDKDFLCPICMSTMKDAFLTACGHSFCYTCITTHLRNKRNCPACLQFLTHDQLYPNFLLNKLLKKASGLSLISNASPTEHLRLALEQGAEVSVKELDALLGLLAEKKRKAEQEEAEANMEILLEFLQHSKQQKLAKLNELQEELVFLKNDISLVERKRQELQKLRDRSTVRMRLAAEAGRAAQDPLSGSKPGGASPVGPSRGGQGGAAGGQMKKGKLESGVEGGMAMVGINHGSLARAGDAMHHPGVVTDVPLTMTEPAGVPSAAVANIAKKKRVFEQFEDLQEAYIQKKRKMKHVVSQRGTVGSEAHCQDDGWNGLDEFQNVLNGFTRYSRLRVIAELRQGDLFHSSNIVSSIEFDRDDELFATAGVSRRIKVFEFATVVNELADVHCPVVDMSTRSKLSCLSWNKYIKSHIASSDYEGIVTIWDVNTCSSINEYEEHEKRAWSVDFSRTEPTNLVSGSDDGKVKVWCTRQENSVINIDVRANICCVKYNPGSSNFVAVGSADHHIHYYDLRNTSAALHVFSGYKKAVSYVKFISSTELASASTDSTLRLWDVKESRLIRTFRGHKNEKNFVGLTVNNEYLACGSETNEVNVYYKAMSKPVAVHKFGSPDPATGEESDDDGAHFISSVCWKSDSPTMLAANSQGTIKVLLMA